MGDDANRGFPAPGTYGNQRELRLATIFNVTLGEVVNSTSCWVEHIWASMDPLRPASQADRRIAHSPLIAKYVERLLGPKSGPTSDDAP
jgi:hypothetical protein